MDEKDVFREALSNFTFDVASGGAIAHLADLGYTPAQIQKMLDFPTPYERVREAYLKCLLDKRIIVEEKGELGRHREKAHFETEYDAYGHKSFRRVVEQEESGGQELNPEEFESVRFNPDVHGAFADFLLGCGQNAYVSCDFGLRERKSKEAYEAFLKPLQKQERLYMEGIPWQLKVVWHLLDQRMREILAVLYEQSAYHGTILLLDEKKQVIF